MGAAELASRFRVAGVAFADTEHGLVRVQVSQGGSAGELFLQGAQVTAWQPAGQRPVIFTSARAVFAPGKAIRGGVPVILPWFGPHPTAPTAPQHGVARTAPWRLERVEEAMADGIGLTLALDGAGSDWWPEAAVARLRVVFGSELRLDLAVENRAAQAIEFEEALHAYFAISDIASVSVTGLEGCRFIDKTAGGARRPPTGGRLTLASETDSVYLDTPATVAIEDPAWRRRILVEKEGAASTIVWNPWADKAAAMADLGPDQWQGMICVEAGNVADNKISLAAGATHRMSTRISVAGG